MGTQTSVHEIADTIDHAATRMASDERIVFLIPFDLDASFDARRLPILTSPCSEATGMPFSLENCCRGIHDVSAFLPSTGVPVYLQRVHGRGGTTSLL
jgi:hypothetical protein